MSLEALWQYCHTWITYRSACRVTLAMTDHVPHGTFSHMWLGHVQGMTNVQVTETCVTHAHMAQTHIELIQMTDPASVQATQSHTMMKLPIKQSETHTNNKIHGETIPMTILAGLLLDHSSEGKFDWTHQM